MTLWRWTELLSACGLPAGADQPDEPGITGISIDTRSLQPGDLFVALSAARDGHEFIADAEARGAAAVMVSRHVDTSLPQLRVNDTLDGLWALGRCARGRMQGKVAAITGSSGKTTARQWLQAVLAGQGRVHGSEGSFNNHWGVPLSLARMPRETDFGVFEVGMNHPGEIAPLAELVAPQVALIVNVLPAHLGHFDSLDGIRLEKLSIARGLGPEGRLVVPDSLDCSGVATPELVTFGFGENAMVQGRADAGNARVSARVDGRSFDYVLDPGGEHRVLTSLAVLATAYALGADLVDVCERFNSVVTPSGRGNVIPAGEFEIIDDSYNANPVSMRYALEALVSRGLNLNAGASGRRIAILGEMRELGSDGHRMHLELAPYCQLLDGVITVGDGFADFGQALASRHWAHYDRAEEIDLPRLVEKLEPGDAILVKGANKVFWAQNFVTRLEEAILAVGTDSAAGNSTNTHTDAGVNTGVAPGADQKKCP